MAHPQRIDVSLQPHSDPVWARVRSEAEAVVRQEPQIAGFIASAVLEHGTLDAAIVHRISRRLDHADVSAAVIAQAFIDALRDAPEIGEAFRADVIATYAIQTHRLAHWLWHKHRKDFALYLQSRASAAFQTDIHPAAKIGRGIFLDHATGLVVGETAAIADDVSLLHGVTLGGTGNENGDRHPKIGKGVMIGAGAKILGNIAIGHCARVAAGSVVIKPVPNNVTVAGVPARVIGEAGCAEPSRTMDQMLYNLGV
jgi:serine O-acetyltransferase